MMANWEIFVAGVITGMWLAIGCAYIKLITLRRREGLTWRGQPR